MDFLQRITPGSKLKGFSSRFYNVLVDVVDSKLSSDAFLSKGISDLRHAVQIVNSTGSTLDQFAIVGLGEVAVLPVDDENQFRNEVLFYAAAPESSSRFAIIQDIIPDGNIGKGLLFGVSKVKISVTDSTHIYADPIDSDTAKMASGTHGQAGILWTDDIPAAAVGGTILTGSGVPSGGTGSDGSYYKDTLNSQYYGPKAAGAWGSAHDYGTGIVWAVVLFGSVATPNNYGKIYSFAAAN